RGRRVRAGAVPVVQRARRGGGRLRRRLLEGRRLAASEAAVVAERRLSERWFVRERSGWLAVPLVGGDCRLRGGLQVAPQRRICSGRGLLVWIPGVCRWGRGAGVRTRRGASRRRRYRLERLGRRLVADAATRRRRLLRERLGG